MAIDLSQTLVIGVSSRALFNLEEENKIFEEKGVDEYKKYQLENEDQPLERGTAYALVDQLLKLNKQLNKHVVEVVVMSKNTPETGIRMLNAINKDKLEITRIALSGGEQLAPYIDAYSIDLFLSKDEEDVQAIIDSNTCAAAILYPPPQDYSSLDRRVKIAFDADAVLFSEESEVRYKEEGMVAFHKFESEHVNDPLNKGPFANLLIKLSKIQCIIQKSELKLSPLRIAIVTARNAPSHMRVIKTLRNWGVNVDEMYFLGGWPKDKILKAFGAQIFFDDQDIHLASSCKFVPSARVPYRSGSALKSIQDATQLKIISNK